MKAVVQRVSSSFVEVSGEVVARIGLGLNVLLGVEQSDDEADASFLAGKVANLRIFEDDVGKMGRSVLDIGGEVLVVSQFTLVADTTKGRRPDFSQAADKEKAEKLISKFVASLRSLGISVQEGRFGEHMRVRIDNDGPVTIVLDSKLARLRESGAHSQRSIP